MRALALIIGALTLAAFILGSGCTKIDTPVRDTQAPGSPEEGEILTVTPALEEVLDTQPVRVCAEGGYGEISWSSDPEGFGFFQPESGRECLFVPPDIAGTGTILIIARDERGQTAEAPVTVIDEGDPPAVGDILINEIAWAGTNTSSYDEFVEIVNRASRPFFLSGWEIENGAGAGKNLGFSGRIEAGDVYLIANYDPESGKSAITCAVDDARAEISLSNAVFGPFRLLSGDDVPFDTVGDGGDYTRGLNITDVRASMSRFSTSSTTGWDPDSWYTEGESVNLSDGTFGSPGAASGDIPYTTGISEGDALAIITEYYIDAKDDVGDDWVEILVTRSGSIERYVLTDLDGDDGPLTGGETYPVAEGEYYLIVWDDEHTGEIVVGNRVYVAEPNPTGTKDQLVLLCGIDFLDGVCYYSDDNAHFDSEDDEAFMRDHGWTGDPVHGKHAARRRDAGGDYIPDLDAAAWDETAEPSPGAEN
jgi:hypothetical protein